MEGCWWNWETVFLSQKPLLVLLISPDYEVKSWLHPSILSYSGGRQLIYRYRFTFFIYIPYLHQSGSSKSTSIMKLMKGIKTVLLWFSFSWAPKERQLKVQESFIKMVLCCNVGWAGEACRFLFNCRVSRHQYEPENWSTTPPT